MKNEIWFFDEIDLANGINRALQERIQEACVKEQADIKVIAMSFRNFRELYVVVEINQL